MSTRKQFEQWYVENVFDLVRAPLGSRDCGLQWKAWLAALAAAAPSPERDVTKILLEVTPGHDGMGHEVYATCISDVEDKLTSLAERIEELETAPSPAPAGGAEPVAAQSAEVASLIAAAQEVVKARADTSRDFGGWCQIMGLRVDTLDEAITACTPAPAAQQPAELTDGRTQSLLIELEYAIEHGWPQDSLSRLARAVAIIKAQGGGQ